MSKINADGTSFSVGSANCVVTRAYRPPKAGGHVTVAQIESKK